jgi:hypothetical protein
MASDLQTRARRGVRGHRPARHGPGDWRCTCGIRLSGGPLGSGQRGARDVLRFHRLDLLMPATTQAETEGP